MYDRANQPYWEFKKGLQLERFDKNLRVETNIHCKYAKYNENQQLWELRGKVKMSNIRGQLFETSLLYWNQRDSKFYSDSAITITDATRIIKGVGFDSNQDMTNYHIRRIKGVFPVQND
jgi:LPS export ABC transporter protein LptC